MAHGFVKRTDQVPKAEIEKVLSAMGNLWWRTEGGDFNMKSMERFRARPKEDLQDKKFRKAFDRKNVFARLAMEIARVREEQGISQLKLAERLHITQQTVSRLENLRNRSCSLTTLIKLAKVFRKSIEIRLV